VHLELSHATHPLKRLGASPFEPAPLSSVTIAFPRPKSEWQH
jgi:hypothetical protein